MLEGELELTVDGGTQSLALAWPRPRRGTRGTRSGRSPMGGPSSSTPRQGLSSANPRVTPQDR